MANNTSLHCNEILLLDFIDLDNLNIVDLPLANKLHTLKIFTQLE